MLLRPRHGLAQTLDIVGAGHNAALPGILPAAVILRSLKHTTPQPPCSECWCPAQERAAHPQPHREVRVCPVPDCWPAPDRGGTPPRPCLLAGDVCACLHPGAEAHGEGGLDWRAQALQHTWSSKQCSSCLLGWLAALPRDRGAQQHDANLAAEQEPAHCGSRRPSSPSTALAPGPVHKTQDGNWGLLQLALQASKARAVRRLTKVYTTIAFEKAAELVRALFLCPCLGKGM